MRIAISGQERMGARSGRRAMAADQVRVAYDGGRAQSRRGVVRGGTALISTAFDDYMKAIDDLLSKQPPGPIYHYTTQEGLLGIAREGAIWATFYEYLNDASEFAVARKVAAQVIVDRAKRTRDEAETRLLQDMHKAIASAGLNACVCSFSEEGDQLSQWRAYSKRGTGYSIGFDAEKLRSVALVHDYILAQCIYEKSEQIARMELIVEETLRENIEKTNSDTYDRPHLGGNFGYYLNRYALIFKNVAFKDEKEWRLISKPTMYHAPGMDYRAGESTIVPFQRIALADTKGEFPIEKIIVGPNPHPDQAEGAVRGLMYLRFNFSKRLGKPPVCNSTIPFRHW